MTPEILVQQLKSSKEYLERASSALTEDDSSFAPDAESYTVSAQVAHIALTIDWFIEGAFGKGFDMDFAGHDAAARKVTSLKAARAMCSKSFDAAIKLIGSKTTEELFATLPEGPVMGGAPKLIAVTGIVEHTAHHRGSLSVYTRLRGKTPPMPYMDADAMAAN